VDVVLCDTRAVTEHVIGFVGLGQMGGRMVRRLLAAGHRVCALDTSTDAMDRAEEAGAIRAASVADVARASDVVMLSLPSPAVVRDVVCGPDGLAATGGFDCLIDFSTTGLDVEREIAAALAAAGVGTIDAPVSGGVGGAERGTLAIMVAAPEPLFERYRAMVEVIGNRIFVVGDQPGQGQVMKLVNNVISAAAMVATAEGVVLGTKCGLDPKIMLDVLNASTAKNSHTEVKFPKHVLPRTFDFGFTIGLLQKDVRLGLEMAGSMGVPMMVAGEAFQVWNIALAEGGPGADMTTIVQCLERWADVQVR
jgi:3-hydroxyisobutyrate dehydrogenase-like beta-hydroxyacid dehydrogenase